MNLINGAVVVGLLMSIGTVPATAIAPTELPPRSIKHQNSQYWSWAGPRNWVSADGAYGIQITSGNGLLNLDYGFSSIVCASETRLRNPWRTTSASNAPNLRRSLRDNWRQVRLRASNIRQLSASDYGPSYFRQSYRVSGRAQGRNWAGDSAGLLSGVGTHVLLLATRPAPPRLRASALRSGSCVRYKGLWRTSARGCLQAVASPILTPEVHVAGPTSAPQ